MIASLNSSSRTDPDSDSVVAASIDVVGASAPILTRARCPGAAASNIEMSQQENGAVNGSATSSVNSHALTVRIESEITSLHRVTKDVPEVAGEGFFGNRAVRLEGENVFRQKRC